MELFCIQHICNAMDLYFLSISVELDFYDGDSFFSIVLRYVSKNDLVDGEFLLSMIRPGE